MQQQKLKTEFAPPERSDRSGIQRQRTLFASLPFGGFANLVPDPILVLNSHRQIVFANNTAIKMVETIGGIDLYGMRPGEALRCEHALLNSCGCGTSLFCRYCGAVNAIISSLGDSLRDIECGHQFHALTIAVATGFHTEAKLREKGPDYLFKDLSNYKSVLKAINP